MFISINVKNDYQTYTFPLRVTDILATPTLLYDCYLCPYRTVVSSHRKDHALCAAAFSLFSRLIPCLDCDTAEVSQTLRQARDVALRLINAIW